MTQSHFLYRKQSNRILQMIIKLIFTIFLKIQCLDLHKMSVLIWLLSPSQLKVMHKINILIRINVYLPSRLPTPLFARPSVQMITWNTAG